MPDIGDQITGRKTAFDAWEPDRIPALVGSALASFALAVPYRVLLLNPLAAIPDPKAGVYFYFATAIVFVVAFVCWASLLLGVLAAFAITFIANSMAARFVQAARSTPIVGWFLSLVVSLLTGVVIWLLLDRYLPAESLLG